MGWLTLVVAKPALHCWFPSKETAQGCGGNEIRKSLPCEWGGKISKR